jgi:hypothetical protein
MVGAYDFAAYFIAFGAWSRGAQLVHELDIYAKTILASYSLVICVS